jgi:hypothetical protein
MSWDFWESDVLDAVDAGKPVAVTNETPVPRDQFAAGPWLASSATHCDSVASVLRNSPRI